MCSAAFISLKGMNSVSGSCEIPITIRFFVVVAGVVVAAVDVFGGVVEREHASAERPMNDSTMTRCNDIVAACQKCWIGGRPGSCGEEPAMAWCCMRSLIGFSAVALSMVVIAGLGAVLRPITSRPVAYDVTDFGSFAIDNDVANDAAMDLKGLWSRHPDSTGRDDEPMAFYYFHTGGVGLYRYGQIGHNTTNSYTWRVDHDDRGPVVELRYTKTGVVQRLAFSIERDGQPVLVLPVDPKQPGISNARYSFMPPPDLGAVAPDLVEDIGDDVASLDAHRLDHRLWIDQQTFATGGIGFRLYQLRAAGIDGRGTGWVHIGDFDDWSTESLSYRLLRNGAGDVDRLDLKFALRGDQSLTPVQVFVVDKKRSLRLQHDPRDFGASHDYVDGGPSFAGFISR